MIEDTSEEMHDGWISMTFCRTTNQISESHLLLELGGVAVLLLIAAASTVCFVAT